MDLVLRTLERRWRGAASGADPSPIPSSVLSAGRGYLRWLERTAAPEPDILQVRLALGDLPLERLRLAAYAGHAAARAVLGAAAPQAEVAEHDLEGWVLGLARWGKEACALAAAAAAEAALPAWERRRPGDRRPRTVVLAVRRLLDGPPDDRQAGAVQRAVWDATFAGPFMPVARNLGACALGARRAEVSCQDGAARAAQAAGAAEHLSGEAVRAAMRESLARWALARRSAVGAA